MGSEMNMTLVKEHIETLAAETLSVKAAFEDIYHLLKGFDDMKFKNDKNEVMQPLQFDEDKLRNRYNELLDISKSEAVLIKGVCDRYIEVILAAIEDKTVTKKALLQELEYFIKETETRHKQARSVADAWDNLRLEVQNYQTTIQNNLDAAQEKIPTELRQQLAESQGKFTTITQQLAALANFWQWVQNDLQGALVNIGNIDPENVSTYALKSRAGPRLAGSVYIGLSQVLGTYISQMTLLEKNETN